MPSLDVILKLRWVHPANWNIYYQYFTKVKRIPEIRGAEQAYARSAPLISGFSQLFRDLLTIVGT
jgi:hypothetical protein